MVHVFISYAPEDDRLFRRLNKHLSSLRRQGVIDHVTSRCVLPGSDWREEAGKHLSSASVILLFVSPDYLDSDYCYDVEVRKAVERHRAAEAVVIPIIVQPSFWEGAPFAGLKALPGDGRPVTAWPHRGLAWMDVVQGIVAAIRDLETRLQGEKQSA